MWWLAYLFHYLDFHLQRSHSSNDNQAACKVIGLHLATDSSSLLELVVKKIVKLSTNASSSLPDLKFLFPEVKKSFPFTFQSSI